MPHTSVQAACTEHAVTRDKMKELMAKFKKEREFRQAPSSLSTQTAGTQLSRKGTGKVLILESRAPSQLLHNSSSQVTPLSSSHANEARLPQRKLVFPGGDTCPHLRHSGKPKKRMGSCSFTSRKGQSSDEATPTVSHKPSSRVSAMQSVVHIPSLLNVSYGVKIERYMDIAVVGSFHWAHIFHC